MEKQRKRYSKEHWLRSSDPEKALSAYLEQQSKAYSRVKNAFVKELLGDLSGKRFLDFGCGAGMFTVHAALQGALEVVGVDAEETALSAARYFAESEGVDHLCSFVRSEHFPILGSRPRFDVILMKDVIEHVQDDQDLLYAASEAIAPGGCLVLSTQNSLSLNYLLQGTRRPISFDAVALTITFHPKRLYGKTPPRVLSIQLNESIRKNSLPEPGSPGNLYGTR